MTSDLTRLARDEMKRIKALERLYPTDHLHLGLTALANQLSDSTRITGVKSAGFDPEQLRLRAHDPLFESLRTVVSPMLELEERQRTIATVINADLASVRFPERFMDAIRDSALRVNEAFREMGAVENAMSRLRWPAVDELAQVAGQVAALYGYEEDEVAWREVMRQSFEAAGDPHDGATGTAAKGLLTRLVEFWSKFPPEQRLVLAIVYHLVVLPGLQDLVVRRIDGRDELLQRVEEAGEENDRIVEAVEVMQAQLDALTATAMLPRPYQARARALVREGPHRGSPVLLKLVPNDSVLVRARVGRWGYIEFRQPGTDSVSYGWVHLRNFQLAE